MGAKIFSSISLRILCFFVISGLLVFSPAVFGRNLSSTPTGSGENSKIGVGPGHSSTAPSATGQRSPTKQSPSFSYNYRSVVSRSTTICNTSGSYSSCTSETSPPTMSDTSETSPPTMSDTSETSPPTMSDTSETSPPTMSDTSETSPPAMSDTDCGCNDGSIP